MTVNQHSTGEEASFNISHRNVGVLEIRGGSTSGAISEYEPSISVSGEAPRQRSEARSPVLAKRVERDRVFERISVRFNVAITKAREACATFKVAVANGDPVDKGRSGYAAYQALVMLWDCRHKREEAWVDTLNSLMSAVQSEDYEAYTVTQADAVNFIVACVLSGSNVSEEDSAGSRVRLRRAGLDPWKLMSATDHKQSF